MFPCFVLLPEFGSLFYLVVVSGVSQQATEGDGVGDAAQVDEKHSGDGLNVETLIEITRHPWQFPLYVQVQTTTEAIVQGHTQWLGCVTYSTSQHDTYYFLQSRRVESTSECHFP